MKIVVLTNNDVYGGILIYPLLKHRAKDVSAIFVSDGIMGPQKNHIHLFKNIVKKSGWSFALFLVSELLSYKIAIYFRKFLNLNKYDKDSVIDTPSNLAKKFHIPIYQIKGTVNEESNLQIIRNISPEVIITLRFGEILKFPILSIPTKGIINFHPALLPSYKGLGSIFQAKYHNETEIGYTIHFINENIDEGKIVTQKTVEQKSDDSVSRLCLRVYFDGSYGILDSINKIESNLQLESVKKRESGYYSWPERTDVKKFLKAGYKLIRIKDFFLVLFYDPHSV